MSLVDRIREGLRNFGVSGGYDGDELHRWSGTLPKHDQIPIAIDHDWAAQFDISRLYPSWESEFGHQYLFDHLPELGSGKLLLGCDAWTVFNIGRHHASVLTTPLPATVKVSNAVDIEAHGFFRTVKTNDVKSGSAHVNWMRVTHYYFFLLNDYTVFGYRPIDGSSFNMPNNVIKMMEFKLTAFDSDKTKNKFEVSAFGEYDLGTYETAYLENRPPLEKLGTEND